MPRTKDNYGELSAELFTTLYPNLSNELRAGLLLGTYANTMSPPADYSNIAPDIVNEALYLHQALNDINIGHRCLAVAVEFAGVCAYIKNNNKATASLKNCLQSVIDLPTYVTVGPLGKKHDELRFDFLKQLMESVQPNHPLYAEYAPLRTALRKDTKRFTHTEKALSELKSNITAFGR